MDSNNASEQFLAVEERKAQLGKQLQAKEDRRQRRQHTAEEQEQRDRTAAAGEAHARLDPIREVEHARAGGGAQRAPTPSQPAVAQSKPPGRHASTARTNLQPSTSSGSIESPPRPAHPPSELLPLITMARQPMDADTEIKAEWAAQTELPIELPPLSSDTAPRAEQQDGGGDGGGRDRGYIGGYAEAVVAPAAPQDIQPPELLPLITMARQPMDADTRIKAEWAAQKDLPIELPPLSSDTAPRAEQQDGGGDGGGRDKGYIGGYAEAVVAPAAPQDIQPPEAVRRTELKAVMDEMATMLYWLYLWGREMVSFAGQLLLMVLNVISGFFLLLWPMLRWIIMFLMAVCFVSTVALTIFLSTWYHLESAIVGTISTVVCAVPAAPYLLSWNCSPIPHVPKSDSFIPESFIPDSWDTINMKLDNAMQITSDNRFDPTSMVLINQAIAHLAIWINFSDEIPSRERIITNLYQYVDDSDPVVTDLQTFNSHVGRLVDWVLSITDHTMHDLDLICQKHESRGFVRTVSDWTLDLVGWSLGFPPSRSLEALGKVSFRHHIESIEPDINLLIIEASNLLKSLNNLKDRLITTTRLSVGDVTQLQKRHRNLMWWDHFSVWRMLGFSSEEMYIAERDIQTLSQLEGALGSASTGVALALADFQGIQAEINHLQRRLGDSDDQRSIVLRGVSRKAEADKLVRMRLFIWDMRTAWQKLRNRKIDYGRQDRRESDALFRGGHAYNDRVGISAMM